MTRFVFLGLLSLLAADKPKTKVQVHLTASAVWVVYSISSSGNPDSVRVTITGPSSQVKSFVGGSKKDSVSYPRPAEGDSIGGTVTPLPYKKDAPYPQPSAAVKPWGYREKLIPPTSKTDSVRATPVSGIVLPGQKVHLVATIYQS